MPEKVVLNHTGISGKPRASVSWKALFEGSTKHTRAGFMFRAFTHPPRGHPVSTDIPSCGAFQPTTHATFKKGMITI